MRIFEKIAQWFKVSFEGNRCRFAKECKIYQREGLVCNSLLQRFPSGERAYCGRYRSMQEGK